MQGAVFAADRGIGEVEIVFGSLSNLNSEGFFKPDQYFEDFVVSVVLQFSERRVNLLVIEKGVLAALMNHLVADGILAEFALQGFVAKVDAVGRLHSHCLAPEPALEALEVDILD